MPLSQLKENASKRTFGSGFSEIPRAYSRDEIIAGHSFYGYLYKITDTGSREFVRNIPENAPITIKDLRSIYKEGGAFILVTTFNQSSEESEIQEVHLTISSAKDTGKTSMNNNSPLDEGYYSRLIARHQEEVSRLKTESDDLYNLLRKERDANYDLKREADAKYEELQRSLSQRISQLEQEKFELQMEAKIASIEAKSENKGSYLDKVLDLVMENGKEFIPMILQAAQQGGQPQPQTMIADSEAASRTNPEQTQQAPQNQQEQAMQNAKERIIRTIFDEAVKVSAGQNQDIQNYAKFIIEQINIAKQSGQPMNSDDWTRLAYNLAGQAIENNYSADKIADAITPLFNQISKYKELVKYIPGDVAAGMLLKQVNLHDQAGEAIVKLIGNVIEAIKTKIAA